MRVKLLSLIFCLLALSTACGCASVYEFFPAHNEIQKQAIVTIIAIDKGENDNVTVTLLIQSEGAEAGGGSSSSDTGSGKAILLTNEAKSVAQAIDNMQSYTDNTVFLGHIDYYLIGEQATVNLHKYLDFITREHSMRFNSGVYVTEGKASLVLEATANGDFNVSKRLRSIEETASNSSKAQRLTLISLMSSLTQEDQAIAIPRLRVNEKGEPSGGSEQKSASVRTEPDIDADGFCIVRNNEAIATLPIELCRAKSLVTGKSKKTLIDIMDNNQPVVFDITKIKRKFCFEKKDGKIVGAKFDIALSININECMADSDVQSVEFIDFAQQTVADRVEEELKQLFEFARQNKADFLGINKGLRLKHPYAYRRIEDYGEFFSTLEIKPIVKVTLTRSYDIRQPIA